MGSGESAGLEAADRRAPFARFLEHALPGFVLVASGLVLFPSAGRDDSHISYWSAYSLARFGEILNYNGERLEQSSSLLHVLLLALVHAMSGVDLVVAGRVLSILCGVIALAAAHRLGDRVQPGAGLAAALLLSSSTFFVYWSFAGLESSLAALTAVGLILAWGAVLSGAGKRSLWTAALAAGLAALVRPEMPFVMLSMLLGSTLILWLRRWTASSAAGLDEQPLLAGLARLAGVSAGVTLCVAGFRLVYFDRLFPQPVIAKAAGISWQRILNGLHYLASGSHPSTHDAFGSFLAATLLAAVALGASLLGVLCATRVELTGRRVDPHRLLSVTFLVAYYGFIVLTEGDWMEGGRMISHALPVAAVFAAYALWTLLRSRRARRIALAALFALQTLSLVDFASGQSVGMPLWTSLRQFEHYALDYGASRYSYFDRTNRDHLRNIPTLHEVRRIADRLLAAGHRPVRIGAHQMGVLPYYLTQEYLGRIRFFDANGLTDRVATDARAFSSLPRTPIGVDGTLERFLQQPRLVEADPDFVVPDVMIFQFYDEDPPAAEFWRLGYRIVYVQSGEVATGSRHFPGQLILANQLIAVRRDLLPALEGLPERRLDFRETGAVRDGSYW